MRELSNDFMDAFLNDDGILKPILERVKKDNTLMLAIRDAYVNIYYRGGNILRIKETGGYYSTYFEEGYDISDDKALINKINLPDGIRSKEDANSWISALPNLKELMDFNLNLKQKAEREFQQLVARENNNSSISNETEYFIADIEFAESEVQARFDMLAFSWSAKKRRNGSNCRAAFIEMKYSDASLSDDSGLIDHLRDIDMFLKNKQKSKDLFDNMAKQFKQLDDLKLIKYNHGVHETEVKLDRTEEKPEYIFLLANHNPRSEKLSNILRSEEFIGYSNSDIFDLKFFISSDAGYGMHMKNMVTYKEYLKRLESWKHN